MFAFLRGDTRTTQVIGAVRKAFVDFGVPVRLRSDGGPQFSSHDFRSFLKRWGVRLEQSTPHYPQSNGHAEADVKAVKMLVMKTCHGGDINSDQFCEGLLELRITPRSDGRSPAQVVFGHPIRSSLPVKVHSHLSGRPGPYGHSGPDTGQLAGTAKVEHPDPPGDFPAHPARGHCR